MKFTRTAALEVAAKLTAEKYRLIGQRVGLVREDPLTQTKGGIIIPETAQRSLLRGRVVSIGQGVITRVEDIPAGSESKLDRSCIGLTLGDAITFSKYDGQVHEAVFADGTTQLVEVMYTSDIYFVWP